MQRRAFWHQLRNKSEEEQLDQLVETALPHVSSGEHYLQALARAKELSRHGHAATRDHLREQQHVLSQWQAESGTGTALELLQALGLSEDRAAAIAKRMRAEPSEHCTVLKFSPDIGSVASEITGALHGSNEWSKVRGAMDEDTFLFKFWGESSVSRFHSSPFVWLGLGLGVRKHGHGVLLFGLS
jgi:hypothetical protein